MFRSSSYNLLATKVTGRASHYNVVGVVVARRGVRWDE